MQAYCVSKGPRRSMIVIMAIALGAVGLAAALLPGIQGGGLGSNATFARLLGYAPGPGGADLSAASASDAGEGRVIVASASAPGPTPAAPPGPPPGPPGGGGRGGGRGPPAGGGGGRGARRPPAPPARPPGPPGGRPGGGTPGDAATTVPADDGDREPQTVDLDVGALREINETRADVGGEGTLAFGIG